MKSQRGGFAMGLVVGVLIGLALALAVALYVTKVPVPFVNKVPQRGAEQDAAEVQRNKNWDPNAPLTGKTPAKPGVAASAGASPAPAAPAAPAKPAAATPPAAGSTPAATTKADDASARSTKPGVDPFVYFVQVGAFAKTEDAEQQRARLAMLGYSAKVTEREQSGRTMYRVRLGPYQMRDEAESTQAKLQAGGETAALVRVER
jgi:cell division protein FtsN